MEFNSAAKQLIEWDQPPAGGVGAGEGAPAAAPSSAAPKQPEAKKNTKKRHSFTSLTTASKASQATQQRHSMEISPPVLISSSNPTAAARIGELAGLSCSAPSQVHISTTGLIVTPPPSSPVTTGPSSTVPPEAPYPAALSVSVHHRLTPDPRACRSQTRRIYRSTEGAGILEAVCLKSTVFSSSRYVAIYPYTPRKEDELELRKGEMFLVFERCQDGWFKGTSMHTSKIGVFPGNYVAPVTRAVTSASQGKVPVSTAGQTSRGGGPASPSPAGAPAQKPPGNGMAGGPGVPTAVVSAAHIQTSPQAKVLLHMSGQMTVNQARSSVRTVSAHSQERPTAAVTPIQVQSAAGLPHHPLASPQPPGPMGPPAHVAAGSLGRVGASLACAAAPPSLPAASLETEPGGRPVTMLPGPPTSPDSGSAAKPDKDSKKERKGLLKLLSGASTKRKPRGSPPASPTLDVEPGAELLPGAPGAPCACPGPCDADPPAPAPGPQRRTCSLDSAPVAPPPRQPCSSLGPAAGDARPAVCERHRVVVSYPPQSEAELELKEGDIVFVHRKREDGWFKGTLQRNGKTGLFPGSFVENI
eukprot:bmy_15283T0